VEFGGQVVHARNVNVRLYESPDDFGPVSRWVYRRDPVSFATELTTLRTSKWPRDQLLLAGSDCDGVVGAALQMRSAVLLVSGLPRTLAKDAAAALAPVRADLPAVRGTLPTAAAFSRAWAEATGAVVETSFTETLYRLGDLAAPDGVAGEPRLAGAQDGELLVGWLDAFFVEAFNATSNPSARRGLVRDIAAAGGHVVL
jgi:hypothetical protein